MKREIIFAPLARLEFEDAVAWYEKQRAGLSDEFRIEVHAALQKVLISPERFRLAASTIHKAILRRFPYSIYYAVELNAVNVISIFHGARNPAALRHRLK